MEQVELYLFACRTRCCRQLQQVRLQSFHYFKFKIVGSRIILNIPHFKLSSMHTRCQGRKQILHDTFSIRSGDQLIITVQVEAEWRIAVNDQHHIMSDTATGYIHAALVPETCHKERSRINGTAAYKCRIIHIQGTYLRSIGIVFRIIIRTSDTIIQISTLCFQVVRFIRSIQVHLSEFIRIRNIFRHGKGKAELSGTDRIVSDKENIWIIRIFKCLAGLVVIQCFVRNTAIQYGRVQQTGKVCSNITIRIQYFAFHCNLLQCLKSDRLVCYRITVYRRHLHPIFRISQFQRRVTDQGESELIPACTQIPLSLFHYFTQRQAASVLFLKQIPDQHLIDREVGRRISHTGCRKQTDTATDLIQENLLAGRSNRSVKTTEVASRRDPDRQTFISWFRNIAFSQYLFITPGSCITMSGIVNQQ